jgi:hypothetical protein
VEAQELLNLMSMELKLFYPLSSTNNTNNDIHGNATANKTATNPNLSFMDCAPSLELIN